MKHTRESVKQLINESRRCPGRRINLSEQDLSGIDLHELDLRGADLRGADLRGVNFQGASLEGASLQEADLQEANLDLTGYELSLRTIGIIADTRLVSQLLYHLCRMDVKGCPEWDELRNDERLIALANQSHVIDKHVEPEIEPLTLADR